MKRLLSYVVGAAGFGIGIATFIAAFLAYFIIKVGPHGQTFDGIGRRVTEAPQWARKLLGAQDYWAGLQWRVLDTLVFFGVLFVAWKLIEFSTSLGRRDDDIPGHRR